MMAKVALALLFLASDWSQFRGPLRDGLSAETGLLKQWPSTGPALLWKASGLGGGYAGISTFGDRLYTMGDAADACYLFALHRADGKEAWRARVGQAVGHKKYPGPRATPSTDGTLVVTLGQHGDLVCVEAATGKERWRKNLEKDFDGKMMSGWRWSESPLLDGDLVVCTPGGAQGTVLALRKESGETVWRSKEFTDVATYASLVPVEIGGVRQYLVLTNKSVAGVAAKDGKLLWRAECSSIGGKGEPAAAVVASPVYRDGMLFVSVGYGVGCNAFRITAADGSFKAEPAYSGKQIANHHGGLVVVGDHVYGTDQASLRCIELKTGTLVWEERGVGKGSVVFADGHLIVRSERGPVALVEATPAGYREKGRFDQPDRSKENSWPHPVVSGGRLYLRDQDVLLCYDLRAK